MTAGRPVRSTKRSTASIFGPIDPAVNSPAPWCARSRATVTVAQGDGPGRAEAEDAAGTSVAMTSMSAPSEAPSSGGAEVLVDHGLDAAQGAVGVDDHRDAAAAVGHDDVPGARPASRWWRASTTSSGSGEATTRRQPCLPRSCQVSPCSTRWAASSAGRKRPIGLVGRGEAGVVPGDEGARDHGRRTARDAARGQGGVEGVHQHEAEGRLGLGAAPVQRHGRHHGRGELVLDQQVADLGAVAVGDDHVVAVGDQLGDRGGRDRGGGDLVLTAGPALGVGHGVAAERDQHHSWVEPRDRGA